MPHTRKLQTTIIRELRSRAFVFIFWNSSVFHLMEPTYIFELHKLYYSCLSFRSDGGVHVKYCGSHNRICLLLFFDNYDEHDAVIGKRRQQQHQ